MGRWGPEGPPEEAYSRVTDPERFAPLVPAADALVERLLDRYDVISEPVELERCVRAVRLQPRAGAPLTVGISEYPGVHLAFGHWHRACFPVCGCDACDETAETSLDQLTGLVGDIVDGGFREDLSEQPRRLWSWTGTGSGWVAIDDDQFSELARVAPPGQHEWPAWPRRTAG